MSLAELRLNGAAIAEANALIAKQENQQAVQQQALGAEMLSGSGVEAPFAA